MKRFQTAYAPYKNLGIIVPMDKLAQHAQTLFGLRLSAAQLAALQTYERELLAWNSRFNLTAIRDIEGIQTKHFLDSFTCLLALRESVVERVIDVGTGAGFPGIPLKIIYPAMHLTLVESIGKKVTFCQHMVKTLRLEGVEVLQERVETLGQNVQHRERYDWAVARAVANLPTLSEYLLPLVRVGGRALAMKGESGPAEAQRAEHAMRILGGHLRQIIPVTLPGVVEDRYLVVMDKIAATPHTYPRRVGQAEKKPL
jgi:16S rRNA (guanine527-N7)-methyltransferase